MAAAGSSSRFAVTCGLLSQYMRERQQPQPPVTVLEAVAEEEEEDARTMQLFPPRAAATDGVATPSAGTAPLTIFYDGRMVVVDDVPAEKAAELMRLAGSACSPPPPPPQPAHAAALPEMPIARKASLQRFLQKRKHRITTTSEPYKKAAVASPAPEKSFAVAPVKDEPATWLGL
uniref:Protein TIFY n=1 Tax=Oryza barthii TaxID=65489 RepID=A0A0D3HD89_9ORYZ